MENFKIVTDSGADLPAAYLEENNVGYMHMIYILEGRQYAKENGISEDMFYAKMRGGAMPTTSQLNPAAARAYLERYIKENPNILYISFSSGLSGTCSSARLAAQELMEEVPGCKIVVLDSLSASLGQGLVVHWAVQLQKSGKSMEETKQWLQEHLQNFVQVFTVDDLNHLYRGGRVSKTAAFVGTIAGIKPILHVDAQGHLTTIAKVRGRKKSLLALVDYMQEHMGSFRDKQGAIFISHGDAAEDAQFIKNEVQRRFGITNFLIHYIGPVIGAHSGPGTLALFFLGEKR